MRTGVAFGDGGSVLFCLVELEPAAEIPFVPRPDCRARMAEPLPVRLIAVADVSLPAPAGVEVQLDAFYVDILGFQRSIDRHVLVYHADNVDLWFTVTDPPVRHEKLRPTGIAVPLLSEIAQRLTDAEIEFTHQRGMVPGLESLLLLDPAGNWVEITDTRAVS
jgi:catechol-2,3-dioxygenase